MKMEALESLRMPLSRFILFTILTLGIWAIYWYIRHADTLRISKRPAAILLALCLASLPIEFARSAHSLGDWAWQTFSVLPYDLHGTINLLQLIAVVPIWSQSLTIIPGIRGEKPAIATKDVLLVMFFGSLYLQYLINRHTPPERTKR